jgi:poly-gamma-glutamate system protein
MNSQSGIVTVTTLLFLTFVSLLLFAWVENSKMLVRTPYYQPKIKASWLTYFAIKAIKERKQILKIPISKEDDPNQTGIIGQEISIITTDKITRRVQLTTTNPNFAAVIVQMLIEANLQPNDIVAVEFSGSFPAINIATLAAIESLNLKPIIITSVGGGNWGANQPKMTWLDMESFLYKQGIFHHKSIAASIGGREDKGLNLTSAGRKLILKAIKRNKTILINEKNLDLSIQKRIQLYNQFSKGNPIKAYIIVGYSTAGLGKKWEEFL